MAPIGMVCILIFVVGTIFGLIAYFNKTVDELTLFRQKKEADKRRKEIENLTSKVKEKKDKYEKIKQDFYSKLSRNDPGNDSGPTSK